MIGRNGILKSKLFSGQCTECKKKVWPCFEEVIVSESDIEVKLRKFYNPNNKKYFHLTNRLVFETELLKELTFSIFIGKMKFRNFTKTYNLLHGTDLYYTSFIKVFYAYHVALRIPGKKKLIYKYVSYLLLLKAVLLCMFVTIMKGLMLSLCACR